VTNVGLAVDAVAERDGDHVLDVEVPSNSRRLLSHVGIARELAVIEKSQISGVKSEIGPYRRKDQRSHRGWKSLIRSVPTICRRIIRGVKIGPSPVWLVKRLEVLGHARLITLRHNQLCAGTSLGQPLHAFDLAKTWTEPDRGQTGGKG